MMYACDTPAHLAQQIAQDPPQVFASVGCTGVGDSMMHIGFWIRPDGEYGSTMARCGWDPLSNTYDYGRMTVSTSGGQGCPSGSTWSDPAQTCEYPKPSYTSPKNLGCPDCNSRVGNPIDVANGNKFQVEDDLSEESLIFRRYYNSSSHGYAWTNTYSRAVRQKGPTAFVDRPNGSRITFTLVGSQWQPDPDVYSTLVQRNDSQGQLLGWTFTRRDAREVEEYDYLGRLIQITRADGSTLALSYNNGQIRRNSSDYLLTKVEAVDGRSLAFTYSNYQLSSVTDSYGAVISYTYDATGNVASATYPGGAVKRYLYNEPTFTGGANLPTALTGIVGEDGKRYATFSYSADGLAISTEHAGGVDKYIATYNQDGTTSVAMPTGSFEQRGFTTIWGIHKAASRIETCSSCSTRAVWYSYDANGYPDITTDARGITTDDDFNNRGLLTQRIEAANDITGTKRTTQTDWDPSFAVPIERRTYNATGTLVAKNDWTYNSRGQVLAATSVDPAIGATSTTITTYCEQVDVDAGSCPLVGLVRSVNGPRTDLSDVTTYTYYASDDPSCTTAPTTCLHRKGDLWKVANALGQVTEMLAYDGAGRALSLKDSNGVVTDVSYSPRGWLIARKVRGADSTVETDDAITRIDYWPTGLVKQVTQSDGSYSAFGYDAAHRLTDVSDNVGNAIHYTLDNAGNRTTEDTKNSSGTLTKTLSRIYNQLGQLQSQRDAAMHATTFTYDGNGNSDVVADAASHVTDNSYDPLNRLSRALQDVAGIASNTQFRYDAVDNLTQVTDPSGLITGYGYDGLGNLVSLSSPDTGSTTYTYDSAGNRKTRTDARGKVTSYAYDALDRLTTTTYRTTRLNITSAYDTVNAVCGTGETFAVGRLTKLTMGNGNSTQYCYDRFGNSVRKVETINGKTFTLRYSYNFAGRLLSLTYPDDNVIDYARNAIGQVVEIGRTPSGGARQVLLTSAVYYPFGPPKQWTFGNGRVFQRTLDLDYRPWTISDAGAGGLSLGYTFDAVGNLVELRNASQSGTPLVSFGYDALNRFTDFRDGPNGTAIEHYAYNAAGDRTLFQNASGSSTYAYSSGSHRLSSVGGITRMYDASGNTLSIGGTARGFTYADDGRMDSAKQKHKVVMNYRYNGKGERVHRFLTATGTAQTYTIYDETGHWIGDYDSAGDPVQQAIWLDDLPAGLLAGARASQKLDYVEVDALGTPRTVIEPTRNVAIWNWDLKSEAFGNTPPNEDPDLDGSRFVFNLRFPGQQYDSASNLNYNYFRDADPGIGRYMQSDPIGLNGGNNTYSYANDNPLSYNDPYGLFGMDDIWSGVYLATGGWAPSQGVVDFSAGFGDSMSFGITGYVRNGLDIGNVDKCSSAYRNGELADLAFEVGTMGASAGLKALAKDASREAARRGARPLINAFREASNLEGGFVHHSNPLFGHPGGFPAMFPTGGLPASVNSAAWNLRWFADSASHAAAHRWMRGLENAWGAFVNPATTGVRATRDVADACTCQK